MKLHIAAGAITLPLLLLFIISACSTDPEPIRIGATMSLTGSLSTQGVAAHNGYRLCEEDLNNAGGLLDRPVEFIIYDDESSSERAVELYSQMITEEGVHAVMGPYGSTLTEAVAPVTEQHRMVHVSPLAATTSIWEQGREYLFMVLPPAELFLAGVIDMADSNGLTRVAVIQQNALFPRAAGSGAAELAEERGMNVVINETYETGTEDFSELIERMRDKEVEVVAMAASALDDFIKVMRQMNELDVNVKMFGTSGAVNQFRDELGELAEYAYGLSAWEPVLDNPGIEDFTESYREKFGLEPSFHAAGAYGSCELFAEAVRQAGSMNQELIRNKLLSLEMRTVFSEYAVDERGYQTANTGLIIQWQDGEKVVVWPDEVATAEARYPTPEWAER